MRNLPLIIVLILTGCNSTNQIDPNFKKYYSQIPVLEYPIVIDCMKDVDYFRFENPKDSLILKYKPQNCAVNGRMIDQNNYIAIIYSYPGDFMYPEIHTYTLSGHPIDTLKLGTSCGWWFSQYERQVISIDDNNKLQVVDTLKYYALDNNDDPIKGSETTVVETKTFQISQAGLFKNIACLIDTLYSKY